MISLNEGIITFIIPIVLLGCFGSLAFLFQGTVLLMKVEGHLLHWVPPPEWALHLNDVCPSHQTIGEAPRIPESASHKPDPLTFMPVASSNACFPSCSLALPHCTASTPCSSWFPELRNEGMDDTLRHQHTSKMASRQPPLPQSMPEGIVLLPRCLSRQCRPVKNYIPLTACSPQWRALGVIGLQK